MAADRVRAGRRRHPVSALCRDPGADPGDLRALSADRCRHRVRPGASAMRCRAAHQGLISYLFSFAIVYLIALRHRRHAPACSARSAISQRAEAVGLFLYAALAAGIVLLVPGLRFLPLLGLYACTCCGPALPPLMGPPRDNALIYTIAVVIACRDHRLGAGIIASPRSCAVRDGL